MRDVLKMTSDKESSFSLAALRELVLLLFAASGCFAETLYNGIRLPDEWPPVIDRADRRPMRVPYLEKGNHPDVVPIDIGRQLFVDDFLVESMEGVERVYGRPKKYVANPVLKPETPWELNTPFNSTARPCSVTTCPVRFGGRRLFVNLDAPEGALKVSVVARDGRELKAFEPVKGNRTKLEVGDVGELAGQDVRFRFDISGGTLYSFWVAKDADGKSGGYLAGGGPGYAGLRDE